MHSSEPLRTAATERLGGAPIGSSSGAAAFVPDAIDDIINRIVCSCERIDSIHAVVSRANNRIGLSRQERAGSKVDVPPNPATILGSLDRLQVAIDRVFAELEAARMG